jgi:hypothetical protein
MLQKTIDSINQKFKSGNSVSVTRASITIEEWEEIATTIELIREALECVDEGELSIESAFCAIHMILNEIEPDEFVLEWAAESATEMALGGRGY